MALFKTYSYKQGAALSIGSTFIWKLLSFVNSILIAFYFGTRTKCDVYFYIIFIAGLAALFFTSLNSNVIIPQAIYLKKEKEKSAQNFLNFILLLYIAVLVLILLAGLFFPIEIFSVISKFSMDILSQDILILRLAFLYLCAYILCYFILDIMYVYHIFSINFLFPLNALLPMLIMLLFHKVLGIRTMLIGFVLSYFIQIITCLFIMKKKLNWSFTHIKANLESRLKNNIITNQALLILDSIVALLPFYLMSGFTGGIISALSYAKQLTDSPSEILTLKITQVYHIQLNENASSKDFEALNNNYLSVNYLLLFLMIPLALFTCYFAPDIVDLFFKRGEFNAQSAKNVVRFLRPLMICLITGMLAPFAASLIASTRKIKESFKYMFFKNIVILGAMYFFISRFGPFAYPYTQMGCSLFAYFVVVLFFKRHIPQIKFWLPLKDAVILVILNLIALIPAVFMGEILQNQYVFIKIFICGVIFLFALTLLYLPTKQLKKILSFLLGSRYQTFTGKLPLTLKKFFI